MIFCRKCTRILEEESDVCPYCGSHDDNEFKINNNEIVIDAEVVEVTEVAEVAEVYKEPEVFEISHVEEIYQQNKVVFEQNENVFRQSNPKVEEDVFYSKTVQGGGAVHGELLDEDEGLSLGVKVASIFGGVIIMPLGLVLSIIYMRNKSKKVKSFGLILLIINIVELVLLTLCCCAIANVFEEEIMSSLYFFGANILAYAGTYI